MYYTILFAVLLTLVAIGCYWRGALLLGTERVHWWWAGFVCHVLLALALGLFDTLSAVAFVAAAGAWGAILWATIHMEQPIRLRRRSRFDPPAREMLP